MRACRSASPTSPPLAAGLVGVGIFLMPAELLRGPAGCRRSRWSVFRLYCRYTD